MQNDTQQYNQTEELQAPAQAAEYFICENCGGVGYFENKKCLACDGYALGIYSHEDFLYWGKVTHKLAIWQEKIHRVINQAVNFFFFFFGLLGIAALGRNIYYAGVEGLITLEFWQTKSWFLFIFWLSLLSDLYIYYRLEIQSKVKFLVKYKSYNKAQDKSFPTASSWKEVMLLRPERKVDVSKVYNRPALAVVEGAYDLAKNLGHKNVTTLHLLASLLSDSDIIVIFGRLGLDFKKMRSKISHALATVEKGDGKVIFTNGLRLALIESYNEAYNAKIPQITPSEMLLVLVKDANYNTYNINPEVLEDKFRNASKEILYDLEIDEQKVTNVVSWLRMREQLVRISQRLKGKAVLRPKNKIDRAYTAVSTPFLNQFCTDLTQLAANGYLELCVGREKEIKTIFRLIEGGKTGMILVGPPGVGKGSIVKGIAQLMVSEDVPQPLQDKRLVSLSIARLTSSASPAEASGRLMRIASEISRAGNIVLFIDNVEEMSGLSSGGEQTIDLTDVLSKFISQGSFITFATSTPINFSSYIEQESLGQAMQKILVNEMGDNDAILVLEAKTSFLEGKNRIFFSYDALSAAVKLSKRYVFERYLPDKAINIIEEVAVYVRNQKGENSIVKSDDVSYVVSQKVNIPLTKVSAQESVKLLNLEEEIHQRVIGQDEAVKLVAQALRRSRTELRDTKRPIANFLFLGPTGVGKTELAKTVAAAYFGDENNMIRLDMSEYQDQSSIYRLVGAPGSKQGGYLTEAVRKSPYAIVLLDELEKAHKDILNVFLQVMDDGRLTDNLGRTIDFTNVILIATSNAGTQFIQDKAQEGWSTEDIKNALLNEQLKRYYQPEFLNRFDGIVVFKPLTMPDVVAITKLLLNKIGKRLEDKGINFEVTNEAVEEFASAGFDPLFGARPLRRVLQDRVDDVLANYLLQSKLDRRDVVVLGAGGEISIKKAERF
ncbi:MAG: ATP-dependent Clp protease ATP-binding subunit [bacterium]